MKDGDNTTIKIISNCPYCEEKLILGKESKSLICPNSDCPGILRSKLMKFSKDLGIKGSGIKDAEKKVPLIKGFSDKQIKEFLKSEMS
jgi:NAD-dependent DNA ligase